MRANEFIIEDTLSEMDWKKGLASAALALTLPLTTSNDVYAADTNKKTQVSQTQNDYAVLKNVIKGAQQIASLMNNMRQLDYTRSQAIGEIGKIYKNEQNVMLLAYTTADIIYGMPKGYWTEVELNNIVSTSLTNAYNKQINAKKEKNIKSPPLPNPVESPKFQKEQPKGVEWVLDPETGAYKKKEPVGDTEWSYFDTNSGKWAKE
jgi:ATP-dependent exoDNAse (exonuclease V) alpha subunit